MTLRQPRLTWTGIVMALAGSGVALLANHAYAPHASATPAIAPAGTLPTGPAMLEHWRVTGDLAAQRRALWQRLAQVAAPATDDGQPAFLAWPGKAEAFGAPPSPEPGQPGIAERLGSAVAWRLGRAQDDAESDTQSGTVPLLTMVHYNPAMLAYLRAHQLDQPERLDRLRRQAGRHPSVAEMPRDAVAAMSAWWPVAADAPSPLPVWDATATRRTGSNSYVDWPRVVALVPNNIAANPAPTMITFAGRQFRQAALVTLDRFVRLRVSPPLQATLARDPVASKLAAMALGRPLQAGDWLVMVALHLRTAERADGLWGTWWWHDQATTDRGSRHPDGLNPVWRNYRSDATFDAERPRAPDGGPRVCFNPWFDAPLARSAPVGARANGASSNCISCHRRAGWPLVDPALVTRGSPDYRRDQAYQPGRLAMALLWSPALAAAR